MQAELPGFTPIDRFDVQVRLGQAVELPLTMQVAELRETVEVSAASQFVDSSRPILVDE